MTLNCALGCCECTVIIMVIALTKTGTNNGKVIVFSFLPHPKSSTRKLHLLNVYRTDVQLVLTH